MAFNTFDNLHFIGINKTYFTLFFTNELKVGWFFQLDFFSHIRNYNFYICIDSVQKMCWQYTNRKVNLRSDGKESEKEEHEIDKVSGWMVVWLTRDKTNTNTRVFPWQHSCSLFYIVELATVMCSDVTLSNGIFHPTEYRNRS